MLPWSRAPPVKPRLPSCPSGDSAVGSQAFPSPLPPPATWDQQQRPSPPSPLCPPLVLQCRLRGARSPPPLPSQQSLRFIGRLCVSPGCSFFTGE